MTEIKLHLPVHVLLPISVLEVFFVPSVLATYTVKVFLEWRLLVQEIIEAHYAFLFHTGNPSSNEETEIYAEVN